MKIKKLLKFGIISISSSIIFSSSLAFFGNGQANNFSMSSNLNSNNLKTEEYNETSIAFNNKFTNCSTPYGYFKVENSTIKHISYYGNVSWTYDVLNSRFLKEVTSNKTITDLNASYIKDIDRIVVFGKIDSRQFLFQLNASDGSEYYVNPNDRDVASSSLLENRSSNIVDFKNFSYLGNGLIFLLPETSISSSNYKISSYLINLKSYLSSPMNILINPTNSNNYNNLTFGNILGYVESSELSSRYIMIEAINNNKLGVLLVQLDNSLKYSSHNFLDFDITLSNSNPTNVEYLKNTHFIYKNFVDSNNNNQTYIIFNNDQVGAHSTNKYANIKISKSGSSSSTSGTTYTLSTNTSPSNNKVFLTNIFHDSINKKMYALGYLENQNNNYAYFEINGSDNSNVSSNIDVSSISNNGSKNRLSLKLIDDKNIWNSQSSINEFPGIYTLEVFDNNSLTSTKVGSFKLLRNIQANNTITFSNDFYPTIIGDYNNLANENSSLLPQDVTIDVLSKYIYIHKPGETNHLFSSSLSLKEALYPDNSKGTLSGVVYLNLSKWWLTNNQSAQRDEIPINIFISGLATNAGLKFSIVISENINREKYNRILELQQLKYPSQITKREIIDYFLEFGSDLTINEENVELVKISSSGKKVVLNSSANKIITVIVDDNEGNLEISYNLSSITSPSALNKEGNYKFHNFKHYNTWSSISLDLQKWSNLKQIKMPFQVTKEDIISCLNLPESYKRDSIYWQWLPTVTEQSDKAKYIDNTINGIVEGTIKYNRDLGGTPSNIPESNTTLNITSQDLGSGFKSIIDELGRENNICVKYSDIKANEIASSYSLEDAKKYYFDIFNQSISFYNNWATIDSVEFGEPINADNTLIFHPKFKANIKTNFKNIDGSSLILDSEWVSKINSVYSVLEFPPEGLSFKYNQTVYRWNYGIPITTKNISIKDINIKNSSTEITGSSFEKWDNATPTQFIENFFDDKKQNYMPFQNQYKFIDIDNSVDPNDRNYFNILDLEMTPNDQEGSVLIQYTIHFPNVGDSSGNGEIIFPQIVLIGFPTSLDKQLKIISIVSIISLSIIVTGSIFGLLTIHNRRKISKDKTKYLKKYNSKSINLEKRQLSKKEINLNKNHLRNTISSSKPTFDKEEIKKRREDYSKSIKEVKKMKKTKK